jgi:hypothetical protein
MRNLHTHTHLHVHKEFRIERCKRYVSFHKKFFCLRHKNTKSKQTANVDVFMPSGCVGTILAQQETHPELRQCGW